MIALLTPTPDARSGDVLTVRIAREADRATGRRHPEDLSQEVTHDGDHDCDACRDTRVRVAR